MQNKISFEEEEMKVKIVTNQIQCFNIAEEYDDISARIMLKTKGEGCRINIIHTVNIAIIIHLIN